jgi:methyl-accepting chemotaxis protein
LLELFILKKQKNKKRIFGMKIKGKILSASLIGVIFSVILVVISYFSFNSFHNKFSHLVDNELVISKLANSVKSDISSIEKLLLKASLDTEDVKNRKLAKDAFDNANINLDKLSKMDGKSKKFKVTIKNLKIRLNSFYNMTKSMPDDFIEDKEDGLDTLIGVDAVGKKMYKELMQLIKIAETNLEKETNTITDDIISTEIIIVTVGIIGVVLALIISIIISMNIIKSLRTFQVGLVGFFDYIERRTNDAKNIIINTNDEFKDMSNIVNNNIQSVKLGLEKDRSLIAEATHVVEEIKQGHLSVRITKDGDNPGLNELKSNLNNMLEELSVITNELLSILKVYSSGDYTKDIINDNIKGEFGDLIQNINSLGDFISVMLYHNTVNGLELKNNAATLASNMNNLSNSSNNQAASLEETSASIEEVSATVKETANRAQDMYKLAVSTEKSATDGTQLAQDTSKSMDDIYESTNNIDVSIEAIDQIAFQTNILSLNAAVEAATAGEAGKGFAVVAGEVRNLASRSAETAKAIKELVEEAQAKANHGKSISTQMKTGYEKLKEQIGEVRDIIEFIANSSNEQMESMIQINNAISELDRITQDNTSNANSTNEIAKNTSVVADKLVKEAVENNFKGKNELDCGVDGCKI